MDTNQDAYYNLVERIEDAFPEMDSDICTELAQTNESYIAMHEESEQLQHTYPILSKIIDGEGEGAVSLSAKEYSALIQHLDILRKMEDMERQQIYFRGHTDALAYLKKTGML